MNWQKVYAQSKALVATFCCRKPKRQLGQPGKARSLIVGLLTAHFTKWHLTGYIRCQPELFKGHMEVTKALAALQPLYGKGNVEIVTADGHRVRGVVRSMKTTQALTTPSVKVERADGELVKI